LACSFGLVTSPLMGQEPSRPDDRALFETKIRPVLAAHCYNCHSQGAKELKGDFRLDRLAPDFADAATREQWLLVLKRVKAGSMPPKERPRPPGKDVRLLADWVNTRVAAVEAARRAQGRVVLRRLNRVEYENTMRDLLGVQVDLKDVLPQDTSAH